MSSESLLTRKMSKAADNIVEVRGAYKTYDSKNAILQGLDMTVERGSIYAFLGPSGCGKTTLLKCIIGRKSLDAGKIVLGIEHRSQIGYMPQEIALIEEISIKETMMYYGWIYNIRGEELDERKKDLFSMLDIPTESRKIKNLSGGQKRRVSLCLALLHFPELLILDEPTVGTDPILSNRIWQCFVEMSAVRNKTIIVTTHYIEEARQSDRVGMMREGILLAEGEATSLMDHYSCDTLEELFIKLSYQQEIEVTKNKSQINQTRELTKEKTLLIEEKNFSCNYLIAYLLKSFFYLKYSSLGWFLLLFIPISTSLAFEYSIGREPAGLKMGMVNEELLFGQVDCNDFSNDTCFPASCIYVALLENKISIVPYLDVNAAYRDTQKNYIWGFLHFSQNYTASFFQRIKENRNTDEDTLNQSEIGVWIDMSNQLIGSFLKKDLIFTYFQYLDKLSIECKWPVEYTRIPIQYKGAIHGSFTINFSEFSVNGLVLLLEYFLPVTYVLTFLQDKREGILERHLISGISILELMAGHTIVTMLMFTVQTLSSMVILYAIYGHVFKGSVFLAMTLIFLVGISGMCYGLTVALLVDRETAAAFCILGSFVPTSILSGMFWPTEGMHYLLQSVSLIFPLTLATETYRAITARAWTISHPVVYTGFLSVIFWIFFFSFTIYLLIKRKNGIGSN